MAAAVTRPACQDFSRGRISKPQPQQKKRRLRLLPIDMPQTGDRVCGGNRGCACRANAASKLDGGKVGSSGAGRAIGIRPGHGAGPDPARSPDAGRQAKLDRGVAGARHRPLGHSGPFTPSGIVPSARRDRRHSGRPRHRRRQRDSIPAMGGGKKEGELREPAGAGSGDQMLSAGCATRHLSPVSFSNHSVADESRDHLRIQDCQPIDQLSARWSGASPSTLRWALSRQRALGR